MRRPARTSHFIYTAAHVKFQVAYGRALRAWPAPERLRLTGRYGTTGVLTCGPRTANRWCCSTAATPPAPRGPR